MTVYVVMKSITQSFENDACWDDGYYDDYYETQITSDQFIGVYATEELAQKEVEIIQSTLTGYLDEAYYFPTEIVEEQ